MQKLIMKLLPKKIHGFNKDGTRDKRISGTTIAKLIGRK
jgi:hypothetical protein